MMLKMIFDSSSCHFKVLCSRGEGLSPVGQNTSRIAVHGSLIGAQGIDEDAFIRPPSVSDALQCIPYFLFYRLLYLILNYNLHNMDKEWEELGQLKIVGERIPQVFKNLQYSVVVGFNVEKLFTHRPSFVCLQEEGNVVEVLAAYCTPATTDYSHRTMLY